MPSIWSRLSQGLSRPSSQRKADRVEVACRSSPRIGVRQSLAKVCHLKFVIEPVFMSVALANASGCCTAQRMRDDVGTLNPKLLEKAREVISVAADCVAEVAGFVGAAVTRHVRRYSTGKGTDAADQIAPVEVWARVAMHEDNCFGTLRWPRLPNWRTHAPDHDLRGHA